MHLTMDGKLIVMLVNHSYNEVMTEFDLELAVDSWQIYSYERTVKRKKRILWERLRILLLWNR